MNVADSVPLDKLADIMTDKMTQCGLIFAPPPTVDRTQGQRTDSRTDSNADRQRQQERLPANTGGDSSSVQVTASRSHLPAANDVRQQQHVLSSQESATQHILGQSSDRSPKKLR